MAEWSPDPRTLRWAAGRVDAAGPAPVTTWRVANALRSWADEAERPQEGHRKPPRADDAPRDGCADVRADSDAAEGQETLPDTSSLDDVLPDRGPCGVCGVPSPIGARHRIADAVADRLRAGDGTEEIGEDYGIAAGDVAVVAAWGAGPSGEGE